MIRRFPLRFVCFFFLFFFFQTCVTVLGLKITFSSFLLFQRSESEFFFIICNFVRISTERFNFLFVSFLFFFLFECWCESWLRGAVWNTLTMFGRTLNVRFLVVPILIWFEQQIVQFDLCLYIPINRILATIESSEWGKERPITNFFLIQ